MIQTTEDYVKVRDQMALSIKDINAFVLHYRGSTVGRAVFKYTTATAYCYLEIYGLGLVRGHARGGNYDKRTAALHRAVDQMLDYVTAHPHKYIGLNLPTGDMEVLLKGTETAIEERQRGAVDALERGGFDVLRAI